MQSRLLAKSVKLKENLECRASGFMSLVFKRI